VRCSSSVYEKGIGVLRMRSHDAAAQVGAHVHQQRVRPVRDLRQALPFGLAQEGLGVGGGVGAAQLVTQRMGERCGAQGHAHAQIVEAADGVGAGVHRRIAVDEALALAREVARTQDHLAPELACFPEAVVGRRVAKAQEDRQRQTEQREGHGAQRNLDRAEAPVQHRDDDGHDHVERERRGDARQDGAPPGQKQLEPGRAFPDDHESGEWGGRGGQGGMDAAHTARPARALIVAGASARGRLRALSPTQMVGLNARATARCPAGPPARPAR